MPELPEVETIARGLRSFLQGRRIDGVEILSSGCVQGDIRAFSTELPGRIIQDVRRRGKLLIFDLSMGLHLVSHLKMTGKFLFCNPQEITIDPHSRCVFHLGPAGCLVFQDQRKFGYLRLMGPEEMSRWPFWACLGPEPLDMQAQDFVCRLQARRAAIKSLLLDQTCIAGIGNIYADESLYMAGIHPQTRAHTLSAERLDALFACLQRVLNQAVQAGGSSFRDYVDGLGRPGAYQDSFLVYGRGGRKCRQCGTELEKVKVSGRTSVFCPVCQKN
ncbi:MAG: bifunctional DNA-formamidopyrimidine glycosylase/DNA-(apurinic or apyrimidinic site) lyase [Desulfovermiculus sp.]